MEIKPKTVKVTLYINQLSNLEPIVSTVNMENNGLPLVGTHVVDVPIPEFDQAASEIRMLKSRLEESESKRVDLYKESEKIREEIQRMELSK